MVASTFAHLEVLGPRATVDQWLRVLQDAGACHLADALHGLDGVPGISRPAPTPAEREAAAARFDAGRALREVERLLPPPGASASANRPAFAVGALGADAVEFATHAEEARAVASRLAKAREAERLAEGALRDAEAVVAGAQALERAGRGEVAGLGYRLPSGGRPRRRLERLLARAGLACSGHETVDASVVVCVATGPEAAAAADAAAATVGATPFAWSEALAGRPVAEAFAAASERLEGARRRLEGARAHVRHAAEAHGPRARELLDAVRDAEQRSVGLSRLAATRHAAAARVYVRREDVAGVRAALSRNFGAEVVVRPLAPADDAPSLPRAVAGVPFAALRGLLSRSVGEVGPASLLALLLPIAAGVAWGDVGGGLLFLLLGALLGAGAAPGSPRRDTSLLAQLAGLAALLVGLWQGKAFGALGERLLGTGWGLGPVGSAFHLAHPPTVVACVLGGASLLAAVWIAGWALAFAQRGLAGRSRTALVTSLHHLAVAAALAAGVAGRVDLGGAWIFLPAAVLAVALLSGPLAGLGRLALDGVGVLRLLAVAWIALALFERAFAALATPTPLAVVLAPALLLVGALAVLVDPAHVAMGVPYDLSLGGRGLAEPFRPLARAARGGAS